MEDDAGKLKRREFLAGLGTAAALGSLLGEVGESAKAQAPTPQLYACPDPPSAMLPATGGVQPGTPGAPPTQTIPKLTNPNILVIISDQFREPQWLDQAGELMPDGRHMCNIWQGSFPDLDLGEDGFSAPAPVNSFAPNGYGLYTVVGNVWEWCEDFFDATWRQTATRVNPTGPAAGTARVMKGGSYLCHASFCFRYRNAARTANTPESATGNIGFRVVRDAA